MKKIILSIVVLAAGISSTAQVIEDSVEIGAGYINQSYYNMETGEVSNVSNNNWDLAFDVSAFGATVRLNRRIDELFVYPGDTTNWETLDTTGHADWDTYANGYESWGQGAFNAPADPETAEDLGWGTYNSITHHTDGDRLFLIKMIGGAYKKVWIKKLASGTYTFQHANLDNTEQETATIVKSDYPTKNFAYYSLATAGELDREPASEEWDLVFTNYVDELAPGVYYGVTGVLSNMNTTVNKSDDVPVADANYTEGSFETNISEIGYDWKYFDMGVFSFVIEDSTCFFVQTQAGDLWKLTFTGFTGSSAGKYYFEKEKMESASIEEVQEALISVYPNPAAEVININAAEGAVEQIELYGTNGQLVYNQSVNGQSQAQLNVAELPEGFYLVRLALESGKSTTERIVVAH